MLGVTKKCSCPSLGGLDRRNGHRAGIVFSRERCYTESRKCTDEIDAQGGYTMADRFYANSLFVSYIKDVPSHERIPYIQREKLTQEIINRLTEQIISGLVHSVQLDDETRENSLVADFREGWATVYIVKECENYYEFINDRLPTCETQLNITGDGPTPKKHATEDMQLMTKIILHFVKTGMTYPNCIWEHTIH